MGFDVRELVAVFLGGCVGAVVRAQLVAEWAVTPGSWPWATFVVNVAGALMLGWVVGQEAGRSSLAPLRRSLVGHGFCGAVTTFSALQLEVLWMLDAGRVSMAFGYVAAGVAAGVAAASVGMRLRGSSAEDSP